MGRPGKRRRLDQTLACGWCGQPITLRPTGRLPKWWSPACRHRGWEQRRAARSGLAAIEILDRIVEIERDIDVVRAAPRPNPPTRVTWHRALADLTHQVETGRLRDRDLSDLRDALEHLLHALARRASWQRLNRRR
jgi:hypothetical protein